MARPNKTPKQKRSDDRDPADDAARADDPREAGGDDEGGLRAPDLFGAAEADGYKRTRKLRDEDGGSGKPKAVEKPPAPKTPYEQFMEQHWEAWLRPVLLMVLAVAGVAAYRFDLLAEWKVGLVLTGGAIAIAIYAVAAPAYDLIQSSAGRALFGVLVILWAISSGYPAVRKAVPRKVLGEAVITDAQRTVKVPVHAEEGKNGPYDVTISASLRPSGQDTSINYTLTVVGDGNQSTELQGSFESKVNQVRGRRGTSHWTEQHNQVEHRLPTNIVGKELTFGTEDKLDEQLESGIHVAVHPQGLDISNLWMLGVFVLVCMFFVETRIGDATTKPHLVMIAATTLVFSQLFIRSATTTRMVKPIVEALFLAALVGGIGGTALGWMARRIGKRDLLKPKKDDGKKDDADRRQEPIEG